MMAISSFNERISNLLERSGGIKSFAYKKGATCKYCIGLKSKSKIQSSSTRQNQIDMAEKNFKSHSFKKQYTS